MAYVLDQTGEVIRDESASPIGDGTADVVVEVRGSLVGRSAEHPAVRSNVQSVSRNNVQTSKR
jgi:hypothetical protein